MRFLVNWVSGALDSAAYRANPRETVDYRAYVMPMERPQYY